MDKNKEIADYMKQMVKDMEESINQAYYDMVLTGTGIVNLPSGYQKDTNPAIGNRIYSSILGKHIDAETGKVIEE